MSTKHCVGCGGDLREDADLCAGCGRSTDEAESLAGGNPGRRAISLLASARPAGREADPPSQQYPSRQARLLSRGKKAAREGLRERIIDLEGMPRGVRFLAIFGYACVVALLIAVLLLEILGQTAPFVYFEISEETWRVPLPATVASSLAFVVGWAFLLTGASDCRRRVFLPIVGFFLLQLFVMFPPYVASGKILAIWVLTLPLVVLPVVTRLFTGHLRYWRDFAVVEFVFWAAVVASFLAVEWVYSETNSLVALSLSANLQLLLVVSIPFWVLLGLDIADVAVDLARSTVLGLHQSLSEGALRAVVAPALLALALIPATIAALTGDALWSVDLLALVLLFAGALILAAARRLTAGAAATLLALGVVSLVFTLGAFLANEGTDFTELALSTTGLIPPTLLFAGLVAYDLLNFGLRFAATEGRVMPRGGRMLMYFGAAVLTLAFSLFLLNEHSATTGETGPTQQAINELFAGGVLLLGPPYLAWILWKRRERLIGEDLHRHITENGSGARYDTANLSNDSPGEPREEEGERSARAEETSRREPKEAEGHADSLAGPPAGGFRGAVLGFVALVAVLVSCGVLFVLAVLPTGSATAAQPPNPGDLLRDDFSDPASGWLRESGNDYAFGYQDGSFRVDRRTPQNIIRVGTANSVTVGDAVVEVDAAWTGAAPDEPSGWGVACRAEGQDNYYGLGLATRNGRTYFAFAMKMDDGKYNQLVARPIDEAVVNGTRTREDPSMNHIRGDCVGNNLTLYVNDQKLLALEIDDADLVYGNPGLWVDNAGDGSPGVSVLFDNFSVSTP